MSDTPPRKKLGLAANAADRSASDPSRTRTGPRARRVIRASLEQGKIVRPADDAGPAERPARGHDARAPQPERRERSAPPRGRPAPGVRPDRPDRPPRRDRPPQADLRERDDRRPPRGETPAHAGPRTRRDDRAPAGPAQPRRAPPAGAASPAGEAGPRIVNGREVFKAFAPCPQGLEATLADELRTLGYEAVVPARAGVHFACDWQGVMQANLHSRIATRILVEVNHGPIATEDDLYALAAATPWERWFGAEQTLRVDTSAVRSPMQSLQFCNLRVKDGICDRLRDREGERPSIDTVRPDARVHAFLSADSATLYLDTSGESLFKRGWRLDKGEAPLRENLAAGMLALSGWDTSRPLLDPFCGSGTLLIEAALQALKVPPGISRPFAFERLRDHPYRHWRDLKDDARAGILPELPTLLAGADLDPRAIEAARANAERAGLTEDAVYFEQADARDTCPLDDRPGWIITNPPYGERLEEADDSTLWQEWASTLKREFGGWQVHVITNDLRLPQKLRLDPSQRVPLYNGALECRLFGFKLVAGSFRR